MNSPWFVRQPGLLRRELHDLARDFAELKRDAKAFDAGLLAFRGELMVADGPKNLAVALRLVYPPAYPYFPPAVTPLKEATGREPRFFSARHQLADGSICLFERDPADDPRDYASGSATLRRALIWLRHAVRGTFPPELDSLQSDLETHYLRHGDVLLGPMMFGDLGEGGELVLDVVRQREPHEGGTLFMVSHVESRGVWTSEQKILSRVGVHRDADFWATPPPHAKRARKIRWYTVECEPRPLRTLAEVARLVYPRDPKPMARLERDLAADRLGGDCVDVPIRFPGRKARSYDWLFLRGMREKPVEIANVRGFSAPVIDLGKADAFASVPLGVLRQHDLRRQSLGIRNAARVPKAAETLSFALAGAGALGSACADLLGKAGVGGLRIVDFATVAAHNSVRHLARVRAAGLRKAVAVAAEVGAHNPHCDVVSDGRAVPDLSAEDPFWKATAVLSTIADDATELALNRTAVALGVTVFYLRALRSGSAGRLVRVRPVVDACFECLGHYHAEGDGRAVVVPPQPDEVITRECGQPVLAASAADLAVIAGLGVRTILGDAAETGAPNQWVWTTEGIPEHEKLRLPFSTAAVALKPHPKCGVCGMSTPRKVGLSPELQQQMVGLARAAAPNETGGILVGRREGDTIEVLAVSDAGPKAVASPVRFERDGAYSQAFLERSVAELSGADYIGEWHSHPGSTAAPSPRDMASFAEIAHDGDNFTDAPLLVIVAPQAESVEWSFTVFPVDGLAQAAVLEGS